ncbi:MULTISPECIES: glutamate 5-kinase [Propionimicrobium]|uniref:Glutamate 5-kinase n=1 Tax=Propionimicrobium lymphophilum ACS-093-V-SCH5 TaxID=883161 RepID=S2W0Q4_9ACTN|nr:MULTISPECIES: glutamate 5-kinase [Propionimicrobium]EPD31950.1 glutamate 5-kinase [Propionimicrobium lymphophilum ACS-093-V-SCH5]ETJ98244.1 glutamate 5-kinase [Propionimicrobium sp. BV2F7]
MSEHWSEQVLRDSVKNARRVVVKVGSSSLSSVSGGLDMSRITQLVIELAQIHRSGRDVVLISSGAIATGLAPLKLKKRPKDLAHQQAAAAVGQGLLMQHYAELFAAHGILAGQVLLTVEDLTRHDSYNNALRTLGTLLQMGVVPVINENDTVATHEIRFGDNDRIAALIAQLTRADALILLTDVPGLYTAHPDEPGAEKITFVEDVENLDADTSRLGSAVGSGGMKSKVQAAKIASSAGIPVVMTNWQQLGPAARGEEVGTVFAPIDKRRPRRLLWLAYASSSQGKLYLDAGAQRAVVSANASLLPAGLTRVEGNFEAGDPVDLCDQQGTSIARGIVSYSSDELPKMIGKHTVELAESMGHEYDRAVVHRDMLIVLHAGTGSIGDRVN